jgi:hypothetical protein
VPGATRAIYGAILRTGKQARERAAWKGGAWCALQGASGRPEHDRRIVDGAPQAMTIVCLLQPETRVLNTTPLQRTMRSTAIYGAVLLAWSLLTVSPLTGKYIAAQLVSVLLVGGFCYLRENELYHFMPPLFTVTGVTCLGIYGWVLFKRGLPDSWGERVVMALVVSLPVILVVMGGRDWWRFRRVGAMHREDETVRRL